VLLLFGSMPGSIPVVEQPDDPVMVSLLTLLVLRVHSPGIV